MDDDRSNLFGVCQGPKLLVMCQVATVTNKNYLRKCVSSRGGGNGKMKAYDLPCLLGSTVTGDHSALVWIESDSLEILVLEA